jgi:lysophospholipase L1-like esterase
MRRIALLILAWTCLPGLTSAAAAPSLAGKRALWLGDSITQKGDYVTFVEYFLQKRNPAENFDIISIGLSSETVSGLSEEKHPFPRPCLLDRLDRALELVKPDIVVACYGMNDGIYHPQAPERKRAFEEGMRKLIAAARSRGAEVILLTPPPFEAAVSTKKLQERSAADFGFSAPYKDYDSVLADYAAWERALKSPGVSVIDLHTPMTAYLAHARNENVSFHLTTDGVHPNSEGHLLMATIILDSLGVREDAPSLSGRLMETAADPLYQLVKQRREARSKGWLDYVGYTRGEGPVKSETIAETERIADELQVKIDVRRRP